MNKEEFTHKSKFLSLVLRHQPEYISIEMDNEGWVDVEELIEKSKSVQIQLDKNMIEYIVENSDKKRFALSENGQKIRANQGHSVSIDLKLKPMVPPEVLFHGTAITNLENIMKEGIKKRQRMHVHLSHDIETAIIVGKRYGQAIILKIDTNKMVEDGLVFYLSDNNVWLTDFIDSKYISLHEL